LRLARKDIATPLGLIRSDAIFAAARNLAIAAGGIAVNIRTTEEIAHSPIFDGWLKPIDEA
jgi:hypothetical protein